MTMGWQPAEAGDRHDERVPRALTDDLDRVAARLGVDAGCLLLGAHLVVMSVLTGRRELLVGTGVRGEVRVVEVPDTSWEDFARTLASPAATRPVGDTDRYTVVASAPDSAAMVTVHWDGAVLRCRTGTWPQAPEPSRLAGYHLAALRALVADPEASPFGSSLLSAQEVVNQVHDGDERARELPDRRLHELVEEQARTRPHAVAVRLGATEMTYRQLNENANRVAHALRVAGLRDEDIVGVVTERTPQWAAALLGVFKAGGAYLPVDPEYPAQRIETLLTRAGSRFVVVAAGSDTNVRVVPAVATGEIDLLTLDDVLSGDAPGHDPGLDVSADQLAYLYFTSGSTGLPKGAMCEHLGMSNHVLAKIDVLELGPGDVVVQNAPLCFDISLWQLVAALTVGARVELVARRDVLDVGRFTAVLGAAGATVLQVVPAYLDLLLTYGDQRPDAWPDSVRIVCVTGEAIGKPLVERWFARHPAVPLVNAYGATEASDDTTHAVLSGVPVHHSVPVGTPIRNVGVYVVDRDLALLPAGAPGEIVFSGIAVGRGYVNDPARTAEAFVDDPHRPGRRLYRTGDFGRWLPDGDLEFLGRRDEQVKIRGMRVELGEVEAAVARVDGVVAASVVTRDTANGKALVAFYTTDAGLAPDRLVDALRLTVPEHLVPAVCQVVDALPLTENGKVDKRDLAGRADELSAGPAPTGGPRSEAERTLAGLWSEVLGVPVERIGTDSNFFDIGGDSLTAVRLVIKLRRTIALTTVLRYPRLGEQAAVLPAGALIPAS
jgi:amino acid adenylation domain-containing protein